MSSLLTEILISLVVIAVIGGIIGWLVRGLHMNRREVDLDEGLKETRAALEQAGAKVRKLESSMKQLNQLRKSEREKLEGRIHELEPLFDIVEKRDARIRELTAELKAAQDARQAELDQLQFDLSTRQLLGDEDEPEVARLQNELRLANRQRESAINRYQNQVRQIEDLENVVKEKERLVEELNHRLSDSEASKGLEYEEVRRQVETLTQTLRDKDEEIAILDNKKQYEISLLTSRAEKAEQRIDELRGQIQNTEELKNEYLTRENDLKKELSELRSELTDKEIAIAKLEKQVRSQLASRTSAIRTMSNPVSKPLFQPDNTESLQALKGIGPTTEVKLKQLGIKNLMQIASLKDDDIERICQTLPNFATQLKRYDWIENARRLTGESSASRVNQQSS